MALLSIPGAQRPCDEAAGTRSREAQSRPATPASHVVPLRALAPPQLPDAAARELWAGVHLPAAPAEMLQRLALRAGRYTPRVSLEPPDGLLLEVQGSLHLFAGVTGLRLAFTDECRRLGISPVLAFAPTPRAALALARAGRPHAVLDMGALTGALAPLPLATLRWPEDILGRLARSGVRTIGAALRLPRGGFARRFGVAQLAMLDALTGRTPDLRQVHQARLRFRRRRVLTCELESHPAILAALTPLFAELGTFLRTRQCGVLELECLLRHRHSRLRRRMRTAWRSCSESASPRSRCRNRCVTASCVPAPWYCIGRIACISGSPASTAAAPRAKRPGSSSVCAPGWEMRRSMA
jgi:protein ImuB